MRLIPEEDLLFSSATTPALAQLAHLGLSDRPVVSCYLDARAGIKPCLAFLNEKAGHIRAALKGIDRLDFDSAIEIIRRNLDEVLHDHSQGIAVFTRGALSDRHLTIVQTATAPDNRLVYSRVPEILPLMAIHQCQPAANLLLAEKGRIALLQVGLDTPQESIFEGEFRRSGGKSPALADSLGDTQELPHGLCNALSASRAPLLLAGDIDAVAALTDWLPDEATEQLVGCIRLTGDTERRTALEIARKRMAAIYQSAAKSFTHQVIERQHSGDTTLGFRAVLEALQSGAAQTVVLSDWDRFGHGLPWESKVEICFEALRQNARVILCDSLRLRKAGGVGCVLRHGHAGSVRHASTGKGDRLRDVA